MFYTYVLRSRKKGCRYVGSCGNLEDRIRRHNKGQSQATRHGVPWVVAHVEEYETRAEAVARERYYKTGKGREELDDKGI